MDNELVSLNKYVSSSGFCSRREADKLIEQGRVTVNDEVALPGDRVQPGDVIEVDGEPIKKKTKALYIACNKPVGVTSTTDIRDKTNIITFLNHPKRIFPVGRLDKDSDGLILLTNDGDIVNKILRASNNHEKEYIVIVDKNITPEFIQQMSAGVPILGTRTKKCEVRQEGNKKFRITLTQGLNRQIRRMCEYLGYEVAKLTRIRIMNVNLEGLAVGHWRYLTQQEMDRMNDMMKGSTGDVKRKKALPPRTRTEDELPINEKELKARLRKEAFLYGDHTEEVKKAAEAPTGVKTVTSRAAKARRLKEEYLEAKKEQNKKAGITPRKKKSVENDFESASFEEQSLAAGPAHRIQKKKTGYKSFREKGDNKNKPGFDAKGNKEFKGKKEAKSRTEDRPKRTRHSDSTEGKPKRTSKGPSEAPERRLRQSDRDAAKRSERAQTSAPKGRSASGAPKSKPTSSGGPRGKAASGGSKTGRANGGGKKRF